MKQWWESGYQYAPSNKENRFGELISINEKL